MKRTIGIILVLAVILGSCGPRPAYRTKSGKRKLKYYNSLYLDRKDVAPPKKKK